MSHPAHLMTSHLQAKQKPPKPPPCLGRLTRQSCSPSLPPTHRQHSSLLFPPPRRHLLADQCRPLPSLQTGLQKGLPLQEQPMPHCSPCRPAHAAWLSEPGCRPCLATALSTLPSQESPLLPFVPLHRRRPWQAARLWQRSRLVVAARTATKLTLTIREATPFYTMSRPLKSSSTESATWHMIARVLLKYYLFKITQRKE